MDSIIPDLTKSRVISLTWIVSVCLLLDTSQSADPNPRCTKSRAGLPACDFNSGLCYQEHGEEPPAWTLVKAWEVGPVPQRIENDYVYLNPDISKGDARKLVGRIASNKRGICVDFYYASVGNESVPITIYIEDDHVLSPVHRIEAKTAGQWELTTFSCCLPDVARAKKFAIEATSTEFGKAAIDVVNVRVSHMPCENGELVCYPGIPTKMSLEPGRAQTCPSHQTETGIPSCDFDALDKDSPSTCGWELSPGWEVRQKYDGSGQYDILYSTSDNEATLVSNIFDDVQSLCMEIQFTVLGIDDLRDVFSVHIRTSQNSSVLWSESYNYKKKGEAVWKRNNFQGILPDGVDRQIQISTKVKGLKVDYVYFRALEKAPLPPALDVAAPTPTYPKSLFQCPYTSDSLLAPLCGLAAVPPQDWNKFSGWRELVSGNNQEGFFSGKEHYILHTWPRKGPTEAAYLTTTLLESDEEITLTFSYAVSGDASLEVHLEESNNQTSLLWSTHYETARTWISHTISFSTPVSFQIIFLVSQIDVSHKKDIPAFIGLSDISVTSPVLVPTTTTPPTTTSLTSTSSSTEEPTTRKNFKDVTLGRADVDYEIEPRSMRSWEVEVMYTIGGIIFFILLIQVVAVAVRHFRKNAAREREKNDAPSINNVES